MKHQRSSTLSSLYDNHQYLHGVQRNNNSNQNLKQIEQTPVDKFRGHSMQGFQTQKEQLKSIISPFQENNDTIELPISHSNINREPSTSSASKIIKQQGVYKPFDSIHQNNIQYEELIKNNSNKYVQENQKQDLNKNNILFQQTKLNEQSIQMKNNFSVNIGLLSKNRTTQDLYNNNNDQKYQNSFMNSNEQLNKINKKQKLSNCNESSFLKNISTENQTNNQFNQNLNAIYNKQQDCTQEKFSPSYLKQTKQQQILQDNTKSQYDFKISNNILQSEKQQNDYQNNEFISNDIHLSNKNNPQKNENIGIPKSQNQDSNNSSKNISNILNGIVNFNLKKCQNLNQLTKYSSYQPNLNTLQSNTQQLYSQNQNLSKINQNLNQINPLLQQQIDEISNFKHQNSEQITQQDLLLNKQNEQINQQNLNLCQINNNNVSNTFCENISSNNFLGNNESFGLYKNNKETLFSNQIIHNTAQNLFNQQQILNKVGNNENSLTSTLQQDLDQKLLSLDYQNLMKNDDQKIINNNQPKTIVGQSQCVFSKNSQSKSKNNLNQVINNNDQYLHIEANNKQDNKHPQQNINQFYDQMSTDDKTNVQNNQQKNYNTLKPNIPASSMNEFYEQMFQAEDASENQSPHNNQQLVNGESHLNESICIESKDLNHQSVIKKNTSDSIIKEQNQIKNELYNKQNLDIEILKKIIKESQEFIMDLENNITRQEREKDQLQEFAKNIEEKNKLLQERILLLEFEQKNLNTQNIENMDQIFKLSQTVLKQEDLINKKNQQSVNSNNEVNQYTKDLEEKVQEFEKNQKEIQNLFQQDFNQEKKIFELIQDTTRMHPLRSDYEKSLSDQDILTQNNKIYLQTIEQQQSEIQNLQTILSQKNKEKSQTYTLIEKAYQEKQLANIDIQKLKEKNKTLKENIQSMKTSCQTLEAEIVANSNQTKEWLEKFNTLEKKYINLQNLLKQQQNSQRESNQQSNHDMRIRSQSSLNRFRSQNSEHEQKVQLTKNKEQIFSDLKDEGKQSNLQNGNLKWQINELTTQNMNQTLQIQELEKSLQILSEESEKQKKDLVQIVNLMISENNRLVAAISEKPQLQQKIQDLTLQIDNLKSTQSTQYIQKPYDVLNNLENSGLSIIQSTPQFNSPIEEVKWFKQRCSQLEVKLGIKSEEYAELVYQVKLMKKQVKASPQNVNDQSIKSSLYKALSQSQLKKSPLKNKDEIVLSNFNLNNYPELVSSRSCCKKRGLKDFEKVQADEYSACNAKCL